MATFAQTEEVNLKKDRSIEIVNGKKHIVFLCDECHMRFTRSYLKSLLSNDFLFCSAACVKLSLSHGVLREKREKTCELRYGSKYVLESETGKKKSKETSQQKYGADCFAGSVLGREKIEEATIKNHGVKNPFSSSLIRERGRQTMIDLYGAATTLESPLLVEKKKKTLIAKYGVDHQMKVPEIQERTKNTCLQRYGVEYPNQNPEIKKKQAETCLRNYGVSCVFNTEKARKNLMLSLKKRAAEGNLSSKAEDQFYLFLVEKFGEKDVQRQRPVWYRHKKCWLIDFYVKSIKTLVQFDGEFWHGLKESSDVIASKSNGSNYYSQIKGVMKKDKQQNEWFAERSMRLVRVTDKMRFEDAYKKILGEE